MESALELFAEIVTSPWIYLVLIVMILVDVVLPILPSGTLLVTASLYAVEGKTSVLLLFASAVAASFCGDAACYLISKHVSVPVLNRLAAAPRNRIDSLLSQHGGPLVLLARFVPAGRTVFALAAAATQFPARRYYLWSAAAATVWGCYSVTLGYVNGSWFGGSWLGLGITLLAAMSIGVLVTRMWRGKSRPVPVATSAEGQESSETAPLTTRVLEAGPRTVSLITAHRHTSLDQAISEGVPDPGLQPGPVVAAVGLAASQA